VTPQDLQRITLGIKAALFNIPPKKQLAALKEQLKNVPETYRATVEDLVLTGYAVGENVVQAKVDTSKKHERWAAWGSGIIFLLILFGAVFVTPNPTPFQYTFFRILLALAAAGFIIFIPGFLEVEVSKTVRASGAIAVFVLVYFFAPAQLLPTIRTEEQKIPQGNTLSPP
jgi:uncharacterized integral membrane protein